VQSLCLIVDMCREPPAQFMYTPTHTHTHIQVIIHKRGLGRHTNYRGQNCGDQRCPAKYGYGCIYFSSLSKCIICPHNAGLI